MIISKDHKVKNDQQGFTLLEVLIAIGLLAGIMLFVTMMLRSGLDLRGALAEQARLIQRGNVALTRIDQDLSHAFLLSSKDSDRSKKARTIFRIKQSGDSSTLEMTYMGHRSMQEDASEGSQSYVVYKIQESKKFPGRSDLVRGEFPRVPEDFKQDPEFKVVVTDVNSLSLEYWNGERWLRDPWDSTKREQRDLLPHLVRVSLKLWRLDATEGLSRAELEREDFDHFATVVYLPYALEFNQLKKPNSSFRISKD